MQQAADVTGVIGFSRALANEGAHARERPHLRGVAAGLRSLQQGLDYLLLLHRREPRPAPCRPAAPQRHPAALFPRHLPRMRRLSLYAQPARYFGGAQPLFKIFHGLEPPLFHFLMIAVITHAPTYEDTLRFLSVYYARLNKLWAGSPSHGEGMRESLAGGAALGQAS